MVNLKVALTRTAVKFFSGKHQLLGLFKSGFQLLFQPTPRIPTSFQFSWLQNLFAPVRIFPGYIQYVFSEKKRRKGRRSRRGEEEEEEGEEKEKDKKSCSG